MEPSAKSKIKTASLFLALLGCVVGAHAEEFHLAKVIPLPGVEGRIDHLNLDFKGQRLFAAALGNNTVEVVDLKQGQALHSLSGFSEPQGVCFVSDFNLLVVASGGDGRCLFLDGTTLKTVSTIELSGDADNIRYDASHKRILVGYGNGALAVIDPQTKKVVSTIALGGHPESFQLEPTGSRIFVNIPSTHTLNVVEVEKEKVIENYSLGLVAANFPMALDPANHRLFVGCRLPARLLIFDTQSGNKTSELSFHGDCDDVFYDASRKQIYASCGEGFLDVISQVDSDHYKLKESLATASGARTCFFNGKTIYLAVPHRGTQGAEIRLYSLSAAQ